MKYYYLMNFDLGLVSSSLDSSIHVWDVESGQKLKTMENGPMECWTGMVSNSILFLIAFLGKSHRLASFPQTQIRLDSGHFLQDSKDTNSCKKHG